MSARVKAPKHPPAPVFVSTDVIAYGKGANRRLVPLDDDDAREMGKEEFATAIRIPDGPAGREMMRRLVARRRRRS